MLAVYAEALRATGQQLEAKTPAINRIVHVLPDGAPKQNALAFFTKGLLLRTMPGDTRTSLVSMPTPALSSRPTLNT